MTLLSGGVNDFVSIVLLKALLSKKKREDGGRGVKNCPQLRDVIYGQPLS